MLYMANPVFVKANPVFVSQQDRQLIKIRSF